MNVDVLLMIRNEAHRVLNTPQVIDSDIGIEKDAHSLGFLSMVARAE